MLAPTRSRLLPALVATSIQTWRTPLPELRSRVARFAARVLVWLTAPLATLESRERLARLPEPVLFVFNHNNSLESILVPALLIFHRSGRIVRFLVDWMYLHVPVVGWFIRQIEPIPVYGKPDRFRLFERYRRSRRLGTNPVQAAVACLESGTSLGLFPEGTRNRSAGELRRARGGLARIVLATSVPVVPVGIFYPAKDRLGRIPCLGRFVVRIGEPLDLAHEREVGDVHAITDGVMARLAVLCEKSAPPTRSPRRKP